MRNSATPSRRQRVRENTLTDIQQAARELLVNEGAQAVSINAVARRLGMSGPAIYRYYGSRDDLMAGLAASLYREVTECLQSARESGEVNVVAMSRALRHWALANPEGFRLIFASPPLPMTNEAPQREDRLAANDFGRVFFEEVEALWRGQGFPTPAPETIDPRLNAQLVRYADNTGNLLPPEAVYVFLKCWIRLYGLLCMEILEHLDFAFTDAEPLYEACLQELCAWLDIEYQPPS